MEKELLSKKDLLLYAKNATQSILNSLVAIKFIKAELYIVNKDIYSKLLEIDSLLLPHKKDTRKTNIYSIDTFVNILNPTNTAFTYTLTPVYKRKQISDFSKIQLALAREHAVSVKMLNHEFEEYVKNNDLSELTYQEKLQELDAKLKLEKQYWLYLHKGTKCAMVLKYSLN